MARIQINEQWRIESDERCWTVKRIGGLREPRSKAEIAAGEQVRDWDPMSYHDSVVSAAESLVQRMVRRSDAEGADAIARALRDATALVEAAVTPSPDWTDPRETYDKPEDVPA